MPRISTEERQKNIIDEAMKIINETGYQSLSIREISTRVGISEPAIYRHFLNKEDIILGILSRFGEFDTKLFNEMKMFEKPVDMIRHFINYHFTFLEKTPELTSVLLSEEIFSQSDLLKEKMLGIIKRRKNVLKDIIENAKKQKSIVDVDTNELQTIILGYIRLLVLEWKLSNFSYSLVNRGKKAINAIETLMLK